MRLTFAVLAAVLLARCATAIHHDLQAVPVASAPSGAEVTLDCGRGPTRIGTTPLTLMLHRRDTRYNVVIAKSGWLGTRVNFRRVPSAAALSDVAAAVLIGGVIATSNVDFSASNGTSSGGGVVNVSASGSGSVSPVAIAGVFLSGAVLVDVASGALFAQVPRRVDVTLQPRR